MRTSNTQALESIEEKLNTHTEQLKESLQHQLEDVNHVLDDYWRYVEDGFFQLIDVERGKYLYSGTSDGAYGERKLIFDAHSNYAMVCDPKACSEITWRIKQSSEKTFQLINDNDGRYLYSARFNKLKDATSRIKRKTKHYKIANSHAMLTTPGKCSEIDWEIQHMGNSTYALKNTTTGYYLMSSDLKYNNDSDFAITIDGLFSKCVWNIKKI